MRPPADAHAPFNAGQSGEALAAGVGAPGSMYVLYIAATLILSGGAMFILLFAL